MKRVLLNPIGRAPQRATLLNTGQEVEVSLADLPTLHMREGGLLVPEKQHYLRLRNLPINEFAGSVLVIKLEFDGSPIA